MKSAINKVFWGYIIVFFNINLGGIPLLPDFIGYIIVIVGLNELSKIEHKDIAKEFNIPMILACIMAIISFITFIIPGYNNNEIYNETIDIASVIFSGVSAAILYSLYFYTLKGIGVLGKVLNYEDIAETSHKLSKVMLVIGMFFLCFTSFTLNFSQRDIIMAIATALAFITLVIYVYYLYFIRKVYKRLD